MARLMADAACARIWLWLMRVEPEPEEVFPALRCVPPMTELSPPKRLESIPPAENGEDTCVNNLLLAGGLTGFLPDFFFNV